MPVLVDRVEAVLSLLDARSNDGNGPLGFALLLDDVTQAYLTEQSARASAGCSRCRRSTNGLRCSGPRKATA
jgi:hypothetical protein